MTSLHKQILKVLVIVAALGGLYLLALHKHAEREARRQAPVELTAECTAKLQQYALRPGETYRSP